MINRELRIGNLLKVRVIIGQSEDTNIRNANGIDDHVHKCHSWVIKWCVLYRQKVRELDFIIMHSMKHLLEGEAHKTSSKGNTKCKINTTFPCKFPLMATS